MAISVLALRWLHDLQRSWANFREPWLRTPDENTLHNGRSAPRTCLYSRDDASLDQKTSILILFGPFTPSTQFFQEFPAEGLIEYFISRILGGRTPFWTSLSLTEYVLVILLIFGANLVRSPINVENMHDECLPLFASVRGYPCALNTSKMTLAIETARIHMARALQRTIDGFLNYHYTQNNWEPGRELTDSDVKVKLNPNFFALSLFYNNSTFRMFVNFPALSKDKQGKYYWTVQNVELAAFDFVQPWGLCERAIIFSFMLTVEQHIHDLKGILGYR